MVLPLSFALSILISVLLMPILIKSAKRLGMLDEPDERKVHTKAIPRCGGLGLSSATLLTILILAPFEAPYTSLMMGGAIIVFFGILDDIYNLNYKWKFFGQFIAVILVLYQGIFLKYLPFFGVTPAPQWLAYPITFLFVVGVTNAVNLSDGLDGLAAGIMLITLSAVAFFAHFVGGTDLSLIALALIGGIFGFLRFNTHPAVVFMGDTGSQFIGFMTAFLCIYLVENVYITLNPALPLLLLGLPVLDTIMVMSQRIYIGKSPFSPDKRHLHHRLLALGFTHAEAVSCIYILQSMFLLAAFTLRYHSDFAVLGVYLSICLTIVSLLLWANFSGWRFRDEHDHSERRHGIFRRFDWLYWGCRYYIEFAVIIYLWVLIYAMSMSFDMLFKFLPLLLLGIMAASILVFTCKTEVLNPIIKLCTYISATFAGFILTSDYLKNEHIDIAITSYLSVLILVVFVGVRVTRRNVFSFSTQDLLISLFAVAVLLLSETPFPVKLLFNLLCLGYSVEYLLNFQLRSYKTLKISALIAGAMVFATLLIYPA